MGGAEQKRKRFTEMEITWRVISGEGWGRMGVKVQGIRSINGRYKIDKGCLLYTSDAADEWLTV